MRDAIIVMPRYNLLTWFNKYVRFIDGKIAMKRRQGQRIDTRFNIETIFENGSVVVMISDTGHGIVEDDLFKVFDPFYTTKPIGKGTGLGLSVSYNIVKQHGGEISLVSSEYGGTIVTVTFPVMTDED